VNHIIVSIKKWSDAPMSELLCVMVTNVEELETLAGKR